MPCTKCENGKYKWGKTGECKYDSKEACEKANKKNYNKMRPTPLGKTYEQYEKEVKEFKEINLSKVERVELTLAGDLEKETTTVKNQLKKMQKSADNFLTAKKDAISEREKSFTISQKSFKIIEKVEAATKELGVKPKDIPAYMELRKAQDEIIKVYQTVPSR